MTEEKVTKHCDMNDLGMSLTGEGADPLIKTINEYLHDFAAPPGTCPKCGSKLGGLFGSFSFGLAHGEGHCGGRHEPCGWPCRALHYIKDESGKEIFNSAITACLAYHPDSVTPTEGDSRCQVSQSIESP